MSVGDWASIGISGIQVLIRDQQRLARETFEFGSRCLVQFVPLFSPSRGLHRKEFATLKTLSSFNKESRSPVLPVFPQRV